MSVPVPEFLLCVEESYFQIVKKHVSPHSDAQDKLSCVQVTFISGGCQDYYYNTCKDVGHLSYQRAINIEKIRHAE